MRNAQRCNRDFWVSDVLPERRPLCHKIIGKCRLGYASEETRASQTEKRGFERELEAPEE